MATDDSYSQYLLGIVPRWLRGRFGGGWMESHGLVLDGLIEGARQAVLSRFVTRAPADALPYLASERQLERMPGQTEANWRQTLLDAWNLWVWAGTKRGIRDAVLRTGYATDVAVYNAHEWPDGPNVQGWATFWVTLSGVAWTNDGVWDDPGVWDDGGTWDSTATIDEVDRVLRQVLLWKPAEAYCGGVIVVLNGELWDWPEGTWDDPGGTWDAESVIWQPEG